jgi:hypothetical protein
MTDRRIDPVVDRAVDELRKLPPVNRDAVSRIVAAAAAARVSPAADDDVVAMLPRRRPWGLTIGLAAAALVAGFMLRGAFTQTPERPTMGVRPMVPMAVTPATAGDPESMPIPTAFTLESGAANRVSLVGDFNGWNPATTRLVRQPGTNMWSAVTPIKPGRHVYAFMIDDTILVLDPRASRAKDPSLNVDVSVVMVGKP